MPAMEVTAAKRSYAICPKCQKYHHRKTTTYCKACERIIAARKSRQAYLRRRKVVRARSLPWIPRQPTIGLRSERQQMSLLAYGSQLNHRQEKALLEELDFERQRGYSQRITLQNLARLYREAGQSLSWQMREDARNNKSGMGKILQRDAGICMICGFEASYPHFPGIQIGHIIDRVLEGTYDHYNLVAQCTMCNMTKPLTETIEEYLHWARHESLYGLVGRFLKEQQKTFSCPSPS